MPVTRQPPIPGGRNPLPSCVEKRIFREVERTATRFGVSRSFVIAVALADAMGIQLDARDRYQSIKLRKVG